MLPTISAFHTFVFFYLILIPIQTGAFLVLCWHQKATPALRRRPYAHSLCWLHCNERPSRRSTFGTRAYLLLMCSVVIYFHISQIQETHWRLDLPTLITCPSDLSAKQPVRVTASNRDCRCSIQTLHVAYPKSEMILKLRVFLPELSIQRSPFCHV